MEAKFSCCSFGRYRGLGKVESHLQGVLRGDTRTRTTCTLNVQQNGSSVSSRGKKQALADGVCEITGLGFTSSSGFGPLSLLSGLALLAAILNPLEEYLLKWIAVSKNRFVGLFEFSPAKLMS